MNTPLNSCQIQHAKKGVVSFIEVESLNNTYGLAGLKYQVKLKELEPSFCRVKQAWSCKCFYSSFFSLGSPLHKQLNMTENKLQESEEVIQTTANCF